MQVSNDLAAAEAEREKQKSLQAEQALAQAASQASAACANELREQRLLQDKKAATALAQAACAQLEIKAAEAKQKAHQSEADAAKSATAQAHQKEAQERAANAVAAQQAQERLASLAAAEAARAQARQNETASALALQQEATDKAEAKRLDLQRQVLQEQNQHEQRRQREAEQQRQAAELIQAEEERRLFYQANGLIGYMPWFFLALVAVILVFTLFATIASLRAINVLVPEASKARNGLLALLLTLGLLWSLFASCLVFVAVRRRLNAKVADIDTERGKDCAITQMEWWWDERQYMPWWKLIALSVASILVGSPVLHAFIIVGMFLWDCLIGRRIGARVVNLLPGLCTLRLAVIFCYFINLFLCVGGIAITTIAVNTDCASSPLAPSTCDSGPGHSAALAARAGFINLARLFRFTHSNLVSVPRRSGVMLLTLVAPPIGIRRPHHEGVGRHLKGHPHYGNFDKAVSRAGVYGVLMS
eukprot:366510-Chlamydomonas_euryale.AAC.34